MAENVGLALLGLIFCFLFLRFKNILLKIIFFVFWVLFVPNTIYLITDIQYLPKQFLEADILFKVFVSLQYLVLIGLGVIIYISSVYPIEIFFKKSKTNKKYAALFIFLFNFLIAFAVVIGKVQRTESWHIFTDPIRAFTDFYAAASSSQSMLFVTIFGLGLNIFYFSVIRSFKNITS